MSVVAPKKFRELEDVISKASNVSVEQMRAHTRNPVAAEARMVVWVLAYDHLGYSYPRIAEIYTRDHTTIVYGVQKMRKIDFIKKLVEQINEKHPGLLDRDPEVPRRITSWDI